MCLSGCALGKSNTITDLSRWVCFQRFAPGANQ